MIEIHGIETKVSHWPTKLSHFGKNPYGEPIFRVVWSDSRKYMLGGLWDGVTSEYRWVPKYPDFHGWVLERWLSPGEYAGSRQQYDLQQRDDESGLLTCGPYPDRGEYEFCYKFPTNPPAQIESQIQMILYGRKFNFAQRKNALLEEQAKKDRAWENKVDGIVENAQGAFNNQATNVHPGKVTPDNYVFKKTAKDISLPQRDGAFFTR